MTRDLLIALSILCFIAFGMYGVVVCRNKFFKVASLFSIFASCVGLVYSGYGPYFGGSHDAGTYFGCIMLTFGSIFWLVICGIDSCFSKKETSVVSTGEELDG